MMVLWLPGARRALSNAVMLKQVQIPAGHTQGNCIQWSWRYPRSSSWKEDNCPTLGAINLIPTRVLVLSQCIEIDQKSDKKFKQEFNGTPATARGVRTSNMFFCLLTAKLSSDETFFIYFMTENYERANPGLCRNLGKYTYGLSKKKKKMVGIEANSMCFNIINK